jgi:hypothetical protein
MPPCLKAELLISILFPPETSEFIKIKRDKNIIAAIRERSIFIIITSFDIRYDISDTYQIHLSFT